MYLLTNKLIAIIFLLQANIIFSMEHNTDIYKDGYFPAIDINLLPESVQSQWRAIKNSATQEAKNSLLRSAMSQNAADSDWREQRIEIALTIATGANPNIGQYEPDYPVGYKVEGWGPKPLELALPNDYEYYKFLLENGTDPNAKGIYYPLEKVKDVKTAELFKKHGANFLVENVVTGNLIHQVIRRRHQPELIKFYQENGVDPNGANMDRAAPIHCLAEEVQYLLPEEAEKMFDYLIQAGANPRLTNKAGHTPLDLIKSKALCDKDSNKPQCKMLYDKLMAIK